MPPRRSSRFVDAEASSSKRKPRKRRSEEEDSECEEESGPRSRKPAKEEEPPKVTSECYSLDPDVIQSVCGQYTARALPIYLGIDIGELNCGLCMFVPFLGVNFTRSANGLRDIKVRVLLAIRFGFDRRAKSTANAVANVVDEFFRQFKYPRFVTNVVIEEQLRKNPRMNSICAALHKRIETECDHASIIKHPAWHKFSMSVWLPSTTPVEYRTRKEASSKAMLDMLAADTTTPLNQKLIAFINSLQVKYDVCDAFWTAYADMVSNRSTLQRLITDQELFMAAEIYLATRARCNREHAKSCQRQMLASQAIHDVADAAEATIATNALAAASSSSSSAAPRQRAMEIDDASSDSDSSDSDSSDSASDFSPCDNSDTEASAATKPERKHRPGSMAPTQGCSRSPSPTPYGSTSTAVYTQIASLSGLLDRLFATPTDVKLLEQLEKIDPTSLVTQASMDGTYAIMVTQLAMLERTATEATVRRRLHKLHEAVSIALPVYFVPQPPIPLPPIALVNK